MFPSLAHLDRYYNEGTRAYSDQSAYTEAQTQFQPNSATPCFDLTLFALDCEQVHTYTANPDPALLDFYMPGDNKILFCIHPQVLQTLDNDAYLRIVKNYGTRLQPLCVEPSSSTRTLYVKHSGLPPHAAKVHFPFKVSRYSRKMRDEVIEQAINVSHELEQSIPSLDTQFAFLREVIGVSIKKTALHDETVKTREQWGYLIREMTPFPPCPGKQKFLIPGFALYGTQTFNPEKKPLLLDLIDTCSPSQYLLDNIMFPIIRHWIECFLQLGYMLEPHGQNILLEVSDTGHIQRIVHRDLSVGIDMRRRRDRGISSDTCNMYNRMESGEFLSITYDMFMGHHFFEPLIQCAQHYFPDLKLMDFQASCKEYFVDFFPEHDLYMPKTIYYFSSKRDQFNKPLYKNTGKKPTWRP